jgi:hypothetical protein
MELILSWCPLLAFLFLFLLIQCIIQLFRWKNWSVAYKQWVSDNCDCSGGITPPPTEPGWP